MNTDDYNRPIPSSVDEVKYAFGENILERLTQIREDVLEGGPQGTISILQALIVAGPKTRQQLAREVAWLTGQSKEDAFDLIDAFEGHDPRLHLWVEGSDGTFFLAGRR